MKAAVLAGMLALTGIATSAAAASDSEARLKQAAQHFADLEDAQAKTILDDLGAEGVAEANVLLGYLYSDRLYEGRDYSAAVAAFRRAADAGNEEATFQLAEARFWPDYSNWTLTEAEEVVRPSAEDTFGLLQRTVQDRPSSWGEAGARYWRFAWLCTFGGYDCGDALTDEMLRKGAQQIGNLRSITSAFWTIEIGGSGEADSAENRKMLDTYLWIGYASADPFIAALWSDPIWADVSAREDCPDPDYIDAAGRLMALKNHTATRFADRMEFQDCYDSDQIVEIEKKLGIVLDQSVRAFSYENGWSQKWCYDNNAWPAIGACLVHSVQDHYFACTKLSLIDSFRRRYNIHYESSDRYARCREAMIGARQG